MTARDKDVRIHSALSVRGITLTERECNTLRRASITLQRWAEGECGDSNDYSSWAIERDEATGKPYRCVYPHKGPAKRYPIADRERGALARVAAICKAHGLHFYHQTDPRGCVLYVAAVPLTDQNYSTQGAAIY